MFLNHEDTFISRKTQEASAVLVMSAGTATLQKYAGDDTVEGGTWVNVNDGAFASNDEFTFYAPMDTMFRWQLTGDAVAWVSTGFQVNKVTVPFP